MTNHTTIEFTKKKYKGQQLFTTLMLLFVIWALFNPGAISPNPDTQGRILADIFVAAIVWKIGLRIWIWWNHG